MVHTTCKACGEERPYYAKGSCKRCYMRRYYVEHREEREAYNYHWRKMNPEKHSAYRRRYYQKNLEKEAAYRRRYHQEHREERLTYMRCLRQVRKKERAIYQARRNARKRSQPDTLTFAQATRLLAIAQATYPDEKKFHLDHVVPLSKSGGTTYANCHYLPAELNQLKYNALPQEIYRQSILLDEG